MHYSILNCTFSDMNGLVFCKLGFPYCILVPQNYLKTVVCEVRQVSNYNKRFHTSDEHPWRAI